MRLHRLAASAYFAVALGSVGLSLVIGSATPAWLVTMWYPPGEAVEGVPLLPVLGGLLLLGLVNAWMFWEVLRRPAPAGMPMGRAAVWLRVLLYANVVWLLIPSYLPDLVETVISLALWVPALVLLTVVVTGSGRFFRLALLLFGLAEPARAVMDALADDAQPLIFVTPAYRVSIMVTGLAAFVMMVMVLLAQRRDGRWSRGTLLVGVGTFASAFLVELVDALTKSGTIESIAEAMDVLYLVWLARTARELNREPQRAAPLRVPTAVTAVGAVALLMVVGPEYAPRLTYTWRGEQGLDCRLSWAPPRVADIPVHERERAYLCSVSKSDREVSDQELIGKGKAACARFAGGQPVRARPALLALLCPEVIGRRHPELLLSSAQVERQRAEERSRVREQLRREAREEDARCRDPWPALRTRFQATASYYDWDGRPYGIHDAEADTSRDAERIWDAYSTESLAVSGQLALVFTPAQDWATCVTAKALRSAPPPLRRRGWDKVVEADIVSGSGRLVMQTLSASRVRFPDLARGGPGRYRLRLYTRQGVDLILVYPARR
ncbi:hypothetical protein [Nonomuraea wenchangensis]|uniref:Uncharacterized protein n=1 Tax=Nonomuraea wenchangensis TaxID=568860 RepID=A0A1I0I1Z3_9ACTN|nr:hypothetical protein [Nonomuraea wenchangensis]SET90642.1 hypothetical protein SAMN05421811_104641 [Nonomuraea wenchangensis]